jgi:3-hydroxyisobutyrate dehydrogenase
MSQVALRVAFLGLGRMGHGMAGRYIDAGFAVTVWNRRKAKADDLIARGARWAATPAEAATGADAVVSMVADDEASHTVWLGKDGAAAAMKAGALAIECSTVSYRHALDMSNELRKHGLVYIDSPVTGLPDAAAAGKLTLLVGADADDLEKARPFLVPLSTTIRHFGDVGSGTVYKLINNLMGAIQIAGIAEGLAIAEQAGLDMKLVLEAVATGVAGSPQVIRHSKRMVARDFSGATFTAALRHKDAAYAVALAESLLADKPVMGRAAVEAYARAKAQGPDDDEGKMIEIISRARNPENNPKGNPKA